MKNLLIGTALVLMASQGTYAVPDERILEVIKGGIKDVPTLCKKLGDLPAEDKERLEKIAWGTATSPAQKEIEKLINDHLSLHSCINGFAKGGGW